MLNNLALAHNSYQVVNRHQHSLADKLIYTRKAASRLLNVEYDSIEFVYVSSDFVLVGLYNDSVRLNQAEFKEMFVNDRKARSKALTVTKNLGIPGQYTVRNEDNGHRYKVQIKPDSIHCECADFHKQIEA